ncbi:MFS transporter [Halorubrum sp. Hd13]
MYYAPTILESTAFGSSQSILASVAIGTVNVVMTVVAILLIDRVGRRPLLLVGIGGMVGTLGVAGAVFQFADPTGGLGWLATLTLVAFVAFFAIGLGPVFWLLISEIYPLAVRGSAMGIVTVVNWLANLAVALSFPVLLDGIGTPATFWLFGGCSVVALVFTYRTVPETSGRTLEGIEADLRAATGAGADERPDD